MFLQFFVGFAEFESRPPESEATSRILQWLVESSWLDWRRGWRDLLLRRSQLGFAS